MSAVRNQYIYGSAVRQPSYEPDYYDEPIRRRPPQQRRPRPAARRVQRNRRKAKSVGAGYTLFLLGTAVIVLLICVSYIKVQVGVAGQKEKIGDLQTELTTMQDENDTHYNAIMDSVDLEEIRERAETELGMSPATADQVINYNEKNNEYMEQYGSEGKEASQEKEAVASGNN